MKNRLSYIICTLLALVFTMETRAQDAYVTKTENKTLTLKDNDGLNHIENNTFKYKNGDYGTFSISCPGKNIAYAGGLDNGLKFSITKNEGEVTCYFRWENSLDLYEISKVTKVQLKTRAYGTGGNAQVSINGASYQNIGNLVGNNATVSTTNTSGLANGFTIKYKSNDGTRNPIIAEIYIEYTVSYKEPLFYFSSEAHSSTGGSASSQVAENKIQGKLGDVSASTTATFTATPNSDYAFAGWGTTADATSYESTANRYQPSITNSTPGSTANKTLYAIFKPVFNFAASAVSSKEEYGTVTASVDAATVLGDTPESTSASTTARFTATPETGCTFNGWYDNRYFSGSPVSLEQSYSLDITNTEKGKTLTKTLYARFKKNQTISWDNEITDLTIINELATNTATATSGLAVTYSSSNPDIIAVDDLSGALTVKATEGSSVITVSQAGNDDFNPAASISRTFTIVEKRQPDFTPDSKFNGQSAALKVNEPATITLQNVSDGLEGDFKVTSSSDGVVRWDRVGNTLTITALKEGNTTLTLSQAETSTLASAETTYAIEVSKIENTLSVTLPSLEAFVDGTIQLEISGKNNTSTDIVETISDVSLSSEVHDGDAVIIYSNGVITAKNAGTAKIKFTQEATAEYEGYESATYEITVNKLNNIISISLAGGSATNIKLKYGATASLSYSSENQLNTIAVNRTSGSYTTYSAGTITAGNSAGTDIYEITQPETYKYEAGYASFSVRVNNTDELTGYVLNDATQYKHGTGSGVMHTYTLSGPGERIYYTASRDGAAIYYNLYVEYSVNGNDWVEAQDNTNLDSSWKNYSCEIPETARYVRFRFPAGGTLTKYIKDVYVYRKTYVRTTVDNANLGSVNTGSTASATISVDYSTTNGGNIALHSDNPHFTIVPASISVSNNSDNAGNPATATLTYTPGPDHLGEETATITVSDLFNSAEITVRATAAKASTSISKNYSDEAAAGLKVDQTIANAFSFSGVSADKPSADTGADFYFTIEHNLSGAGGGEHPTEVVSYDPQSNTISAHNAGRATISIIQKSTSLYSQTSAQFEITVGKWDQTLTWTKAEIETNLQKGQTVSGNTATSDAGLEVTYSSSNTAAITVDPATGELTAVGKGADITITASQAGNYKYAPASITRKFSVFDKKTPVFEPDSHFSENNGRIEIYGTATVSVSGVGSLDEEGGFSIANSDDTVIGVVLDNGVITISALKEGTATLTLEQKGTDDFFAKTASYSIEVFTPGDYITLAPDTEAGTYRRVTLERTVPEGYSTISLPFATTLQQLTGRSSDADKVFTLCNVGYSPEGYTFYFTQLESDSTMEAGEPYVLYLESEVANPVWTGEITITDESRVAATVACGGWNFVANFTANFPMDGKYGVVNTTSTIMKGGTNASLGAFTAYFCLADQDGGSTKAAGSSVAPSAAGSSAAADLPANAIPLFTVKE